MTYSEVIIVAGGTGGHIFPALTVAELLRKQGINVSWIGTKNGMEAQLVTAHGIALSFINSSGLRGVKFAKLLFAPVQLIMALVQSMRIIRRRKPKVMIVFGGYVSGPAGLAAKLLRCPLIIHEQNALPGTTNTILARFANVVLQAFPNSFHKKYQAITTGNPIRASIVAKSLPENVQLPLKILVIGGSRGARVFNEIIPKVFAKFSDKQFTLIHQTGANNIENTRKSYANCNIAVKIEEFIVDMPGAYQWADLVVARSGALTISELLQARLPAILVPFPFAIDDHQTINAKILTEIKAAILLPQKKFTVEFLKNLMQSFHDNPQKINNMMLNFGKIPHSNAAATVVKYCKEFL